MSTERYRFNSTLSASAMKRGTKRLKAGKKSKEWMAVRRRLKIQFEAQGITGCELRYEGCFGEGALGFAHGRKRRHLQGDELETLTILSCNHCHDRIEYLPPEQMLAIVQDVIGQRSNHPCPN